MDADHIVVVAADRPEEDRDGGEIDIRDATRDRVPRVETRERG
jgi:hypothetical protein